MGIENVFSWSKSRDGQFRECRRKYFYDKYASWGGWDAGAPKETRMAYVLKNLKNRWAWKGETVHHVIEDVLKAVRAGRPLSLEEAIARLTETMRRDFRSSKAKSYYEDPKNRMGLFEHEYEKPVSDSTWKKLHESAAECLRNFYGSAVYRELLEDDKRSWLVIEDLEEFDFDGAKIFVKLDFARRRDGFVEIFDWKTGKADVDAASLQMGIYALYAMKKWGVDLSRLRGFLLSLGNGSPALLECPLTDETIEGAKRSMAASIESMRGLLLDPSKNVPKPREEFRFTDNTRLCDFCNFYRICEKYQTPLK